MEEEIMIQLVKLPVKHGNAPLRIAKGHFAVSYTHLTLPTTHTVYISVVAVSLKKIF